MQSHPKARAPGEAVALLDLATLPSAPFWARRQTRTVLRAWRVWTETIETAELLVSELVTNAVKFSGTVPKTSGYAEYRNARRISLVLRHQAGQLIIEVSDPDPSPPIMAEVDSEAEGGRGLMLVQALSKEWDYYLPRTGGKVVYCVLASMASP
jgi:anti-sigma regulatory factor (Ser/Thr protein kinase)